MVNEGGDVSTVPQVTEAAGVEEDPKLLTNCLAVGSQNLYVDKIRGITRRPDALL